jgi:hypothetical protein
MLTVVKNLNGDVVMKTHMPLTIQTIDVEKELEVFDPDEFIRNIRQEQKEEKIRNKQRFESLKKLAEEKGFKVHDDYFNAEYTKEPCYGGSMGTVLMLEKDNLVIDIWANGEQRYNIFNEEKFCQFLHYEGVEKCRLTKESAEKLRKAVFYIMKLSLEGIFPRFGYFNPVEELLTGQWLYLTEEEKEFLLALDENDCMGLYVNTDMVPDEMPIGWHVGYYYCENNNWIEVFYDYVEGEKRIQLNEGEVCDEDDFLDALEDMDGLYQMGLEYLQDNQ